MTASQEIDQMNQIRFHLINHDEQLSFEIFVDNQPFVELIRVHEQPLADGEGKLERWSIYDTTLAVKL